MAKLRGITPAIYTQLMAKKGDLGINEFLETLLQEQKKGIQIPIPPAPVSADPLLQENKLLIDTLEEQKKEIAKLKKKLKKIVDED